MRAIRVLSAVAAFFALQRAARSGPGPDGREILDLDPGWRFFGGEESRAPEVGFDDASWQRVDLPHTWNALDGQDGGGDYRRGPGWYRRHLSLDASLAGRRLYLQFDGASLMADVYVNGVHLGTHRGGFARFRFDATAVLRPGADNVLAVRVDNGHLGIPPTAADFTFFGGLYRDVSLVSTDPVQISAMDHGSPGVFIDQVGVAPGSARILVRAELENHGALPRDVDVHVTVTDDAGGGVRRPACPEQSFRTHLEAGAAIEVSKTLGIEHPRLWNGRADPHLYAVRVELHPVAANGAPGALSDAVEQPLGLRTYSVDPLRGFILNGRYLDLHGFNRHQDWPDKGWAISDSEEAEDFSLLMDVGSTAVRVSHYQQSQSWYSRCDGAGLVAWAEIPFVDGALPTPEFLENAKQQLRELIRQNYNHPAICFWGVGNETSGPDADGVIAALAGVVRAEDPSRLSTYASDHEASDTKNWHTDVVAFNKYFGWYRGAIADFAPWLDATKAAYPQARFGMSEYGAGASIVQHAQDPAQPEARGRFHPEEYQCLYHEGYWAALRTRPYVWAKFIWCLHDFASDGRDEGDHPGRNDKGLVTYDRKVMKDAYYFYKANWSEAAVLHITSSRFNDRRDPVTSVKVYSNATQVELEVDGKPIGTLSDAAGTRVFEWRGVRLAPGENRIAARARIGGRDESDSCVWTLSGP
jgi:beta-galactosidase